MTTNDTIKHTITQTLKTIPHYVKKITIPNILDNPQTDAVAECHTDHWLISYQPHLKILSQEEKNTILSLPREV